MESLISFLGAALALLALFVLYIGGAAVVLRFFERISPAKNSALKNTNMPRSAI